MFSTFKQHLESQLAGIRSAGTYKGERVIITPQVRPSAWPTANRYSTFAPTITWGWRSIQRWRRRRKWPLTNGAMAWPAYASSAAPTVGHAEYGRGDGHKHARIGEPAARAEREEEQEHGDGEGDPDGTDGAPQGGRGLLAGLHGSEHTRKSERGNDGDGRCQQAADSMPTRQWR